VIEKNWSQITIPEALTVEMINHGITADNPGRKQGFCINSWYVLFFSYYLGLSMSTDGLAFRKPMCVNTKVDVKMQWCDKSINLIVDLSNNENVNIRINGVEFKDEYIAYSDLKEHNVVELV
jgi:hypothetical protein